MEKITNWSVSFKNAKVNKQIKMKELFQSKGDSSDQTAE